MEISTEQLVGNNIIVTLYNILFDRLKEDAGIISGKVVDMIPAGSIPSPEKFEEFYGQGSYHNPKLNSAKKALKVDRILLKQDLNGHNIVLPLNSRNMSWEITSRNN